MIDYTKLTDQEVKEIRNHWRGEARLARGGFEYHKQLDAVEEEAKRRGL